MGELNNEEDGIMQDISLSTEQMEAILDNAPVAIYVSAAENMELLYANQIVKDLIFQYPGIGGITCYEAAGYDRPCPFCHAGDMSRTELFVREFHHPGNNRTYQLSGKIIEWGGKSAHIEYILDITDKNGKKITSKR